MTYDLTMSPGRLDAASDPATPADVLAMLASDRDAEVRWRVARNLNAPKETP